MPTYHSDNETSIIVKSPNNYYTLPPGNTELNFYLKSLPLDVTLTSHEPIVSPWILLDSISSVPMESSVDVSLYDNIMIYNASDSTATVSANTDDSNAYPLSSNSIQIFSNEQRLFGCLEILTMGSGIVYIYGVR